MLDLDFLQERRFRTTTTATFLTINGEHFAVAEGEILVSPVGYDESPPLLNHAAAINLATGILEPLRHPRVNPRCGLSQPRLGYVGGNIARCYNGLIQLLQPDLTVQWREGHFDDAEWINPADAVYLNVLFDGLLALGRGQYVGTNR